MTPWFLSKLELGTDADIRDIRRAYARRLKAIDTETDLEGFAALRTAFEAAQMWAESKAAASDASPNPGVECHSADGRSDERGPLVVPVAMAGSSVPWASGNPAVPVAPQQASVPEARSAPAVPVVHGSPEKPQVHGAKVIPLIDRFRAACQQSAPLDTAMVLQAFVTTMRLDEPTEVGAFEWQLLNALAHQQLPQREAIFSVAEDLFDWTRTNRAAQMGPLGQWMERVVIQRTSWRSQSMAVRTARMGVLALGMADPLPTNTIARWPEAQALLQRYPDYLGLIVNHADLVRWQKSFESLTPQQTQVQARKQDTSRGSMQIWWILPALLVLLNMCSHLIQQASSADSKPLPHVSASRAPTGFYSRCQRMTSVDKNHAPNSGAANDATLELKRCIATQDELKAKSQAEKDD